MRALVYDEFGAVPCVRDVADPVPSSTGAVIAVEATGLCRSDWHGWRGHDPDIRLPHVPGHELAGRLVAIGRNVSGWQLGERVSVPFVCACGRCEQCRSGNEQVCDHQFQPGFTAWGSFAEQVAVEYAAVNLVRLPDVISSAAAAGLGCRFATAYRAVIQQGRVAAGTWVAVFGCGGVGLAAVQIAVLAGARVVAVDIAHGALAMARTFGAEIAIDAHDVVDVPAHVRAISGGGAHLSIDAMGSPLTCAQGVLSLRKRGRHVQVGLLPSAGGHPAVPMDAVIARELELVGSHGMAASAYGELLGLVADGLLRPDLLVTRRLRLDEAAEALMSMGDHATPGVTVIEP